MIYIIDSAMTLEEALAQGPRNQTAMHQTVIEALVLVEVRYIGFEGRWHRGQIVVHKDVAKDVEAFFNAAETMHFPIHSVMPLSHPSINWCNLTSCENNNSSGFNAYPFGEKADSLSYAFGRAFSINPWQNPYVEYAQGKPRCIMPAFGEYNRHAPGTLYDRHSLVAFMRRQGWSWGGIRRGDDSTVSYKRFQKLG